MTKAEGEEEEEEAEAEEGVGEEEEASIDPLHSHYEYFDHFKISD